jgi:hypothetical protein
MSKNKKYNTATLEELCKDKNIDYSKIEFQNKLTRLSCIKGNCTSVDCRGVFYKRFDQIYIYGGKCDRCTNIRTNKYTLEALNELDLKLSRKYFRDELHCHFIIKGNCKTELCMNTFSRKFCTLLKIGGYCDRCALQKGNKKKVDTFKERYGVENISQLEHIKKQKEETCKQNHGVSYATQSPIIQAQIIETSLQNWGTNRPTQNRELLHRIQKDYEIKTGYLNPFLNPDVQVKINEKNILNFGCVNPFSNEMIQNKIKETNIAKYGFPNPMQNSTILKKAFKTGCKLKPYTLPSGKVIEYMGYENYALEELLKMYEENDIENDMLPIFHYKKQDGTDHTYLPDIFIKSHNKFIEVKSTYTITQDHDTILLKQQSVKNAGFDCEIWVYNNSGEKIEIL